MDLSQRPTSTYSNVEPSKDGNVPINFNKDYGYNKTFDNSYDKTFNKPGFDNTQSLPQQNQGLLGSLPQQNQQIAAPPSSNFNQSLPQQQSVHIPVQSSQLQQGALGSDVQTHVIPTSQSQGHAPPVAVPTAIPAVPSSQQQGTDASLSSGGNLISGQQEYSSLISKLKTMIFGYESDYTNDPNFTAPLTLPSGIKTTITEIPEQLKKMLLEKEPTFDRDLPTKEFFKDLPEREVIRHRVVHPVQVQTIMHTVVHPSKKIEIRHAAPHEVVHEVIHEIPHEVHHVVQHHVPFEVEHVVEHQVHDNVKHVMRHGVHQMVNHEIKEEVKHNILHGINRMMARGPVEAEIAEDNKIPHSVSRTAPFINQSITSKLLESFESQKFAPSAYSSQQDQGSFLNQSLGAKPIGVNQIDQAGDYSIEKKLIDKTIIDNNQNQNFSRSSTVDRSV